MELLVLLVQLDVTHLTAIANTVNIVTLMEFVNLAIQIVYHVLALDLINAFNVLQIVSHLHIVIVP